MLSDVNFVKFNATKTAFSSIGDRTQTWGDREAVVGQTLRHAGWRGPLKAHMYMELHSIKLDVPASRMTRVLARADEQIITIKSSDLLWHNLSTRKLIKLNVLKIEQIIRSFSSLVKNLPWFVLHIS